ncbi:MAG: aldo/keto reductase, partial [Cyclobacteriaceae bacterium]|nr:aldo/keto reductase [Cyclobacteriaceae bacterium SS2]
EAVTAIKTSIDHGITSIDTAPIYGFGHSEKIVGEAVKSYSRDKIQLLTKFGMRWDTKEGDFYFESKKNDGTPVNIHKYAGKQSIINECEESLKRLGTDYIDLYQIHWPDKTTPIEESFEAVAQLKKEGKIRSAGVSNYSVDQMKIAHSVTPLASNQVPYSMVLRDIEKEVVPFCVDNGIGILAYSPLQRGLLTGKITSDYKFNEGDHRKSTKFFQEPNLSRTNAFLDEIKPIAEKHNATLAQLVINWTLQQPGITSVLVGARNKEQVAQNAQALSFDLDKEIVDEITDKLNRLQID